jgi:hypothetical protein
MRRALSFADASGDDTSIAKPSKSAARDAHVDGLVRVMLDELALMPSGGWSYSYLNIQRLP